MWNSSRAPRHSTTHDYYITGPPRGAKLVPLEFRTTGSCYECVLYLPTRFSSTMHLCSTMITRAIWNIVLQCNLCQTCSCYCTCLNSQQGILFILANNLSTTQYFNMLYCCTLRHGPWYMYHIWNYSQFQKSIYETFPAHIS